MDIKDTELENWTFVRLARRVDAFNYDRVTREILKVVDEGRSLVVVDLTQTSFLSLPAIKFLANTAELLSAREGELVLYGPCDRARRHIEIFSGATRMRICMQKSHIQVPGSHAEKEVG